MGSVFRAPVFETSQLGMLGEEGACVRFYKSGVLAVGALAIQPLQEPYRVGVYTGVYSRPLIVGHCHVSGLGA